MLELWLMMVVEFLYKYTSYGDCTMSTLNVTNINTIKRDWSTFINDYSTGIVTQQKV